MSKQYTEHDIENDVRERGHSAPRVTPEQIDDLIVHEQFHRFEGTTVTVCCLTLKNGFSTIGYSAAVSDENFDAEIGKKVARESARGKLWDLEGYLLRQRLHEKAQTL